MEEEGGRVFGGLFFDSVFDVFVEVLSQDDFVVGAGSFK